MNSYNIRVTSLEEVFNKLGEEELANDDEEEENNSNEEQPLIGPVESKELTSYEQFKIVTRMRNIINHRTRIYLVILVMCTSMSAAVGALSVIDKANMIYTMNIPELYKDGQIYSMGVPSSQQQKGNDYFKLDDILTS
jgi:hypothetical protein